MGRYYEDYEIKKLLEDIARAATKICLTEIGFIPREEISRREAYRIYGSKTVKKWVELKLIKGERKGTGLNSKIVFSKKELELLYEWQKMQALEAKKIIEDINNKNRY